MAKIGLEYYRFDTNRYQNIKIKRLKREYGCDGIAIYDYILTEIYRDKGCFIEWDESRAFDVADYFNVKETLVNEVVKGLVRFGLFDANKLANLSILTSKSIQRRYIEMCRAAKRTNIYIPEKYLILTEGTQNLTEENAILTEEKPNKEEETDKVKKSKVNKRKVKDVICDFSNFKSEGFVKAFEAMYEDPTWDFWRKKSEEALKISFKKINTLAQNESEAIELVEKAHESKWKGIWAINKTTPKTNNQKWSID